MDVCLSFPHLCELLVRSLEELCRTSTNLNGSVIHVKSGEEKRNFKCIPLMEVVFATRVAEAEPTKGGTGQRVVMFEVGTYIGRKWETSGPSALSSIARS